MQQVETSVVNLQSQYTQVDPRAPGRRVRGVTLGRVRLEVRMVLARDDEITVVYGWYYS